MSDNAHQQSEREVVFLPRQTKRMTINLGGREQRAITGATAFASYEVKRISRETNTIWKAHETRVVRKLHDCGVEYAMLNYGINDITWLCPADRFEASQVQPAQLHDTEWYFSTGSCMYLYSPALSHERLALWSFINRAGYDEASLAVSLLANTLNNSRAIHAEHSCDLRGVLAGVMASAIASSGFASALQEATVAALTEARLPGYSGTQEPGLSAVQHIELISVGLPAFVRVLNEQPECAELVKLLQV